MYPLSSFTLLATDVDHEHLVVLELKGSFSDTDRTRPTLNDVLFRWLIIVMK